MSELPRGTERIWAAVVEGKAEKFNHQGEHGVEIQLEGSAFGSQYPVPVFVPDGKYDNIALGSAYNFVLASENLKKNKSGERPYDYYWGFVRLADGNETPTVAPTAPTAPMAATPPEAPPAYQSATVGQQWVDSKNQSIERQVSAKAATEIYVASILSKVEVNWDGWFTQILDRIQNGPFVATVEEAVTPDPEAAS